MWSHRSILSLGVTVFGKRPMGRTLQDWHHSGLVCLPSSFNLAGASAVFPSFLLPGFYRPAPCMPMEVLHNLYFNSLQGQKNTFVWRFSPVQYRNLIPEMWPLTFSCFYFSEIVPFAGVHVLHLQIALKVVSVPIRNISWKSITDLVSVGIFSMPMVWSDCKM